MSTGEAPLHQQQVKTLYANHHGWLLGWLRHKLGNTFDAADIAQDTFLRVLARQHLPTLDDPRNYLSTIARGLVIDHWRRHELEQAWRETLARLPPSQVPSPETRAVFLEALIEIDRMLDALKPPVRRAFLLSQLEGLTCPEIAHRLNLSLATVERYIAKALRSCYAVRFGL